MSENILLAPRLPNRQVLERLSAALKRFGPAMLMLAVALVIRSRSELCADDSWLLLLGEKTLAGVRPYVDFIETNPPASILLYLPAIFLARFIGIMPETAVVSLTVVAVVASLALTARILDKVGTGMRYRGRWFLAAALFVFLILPAHTFAEREHIASIVILPMLACFVARMEGKSVSISNALLAGLGGGAAVAIKAYFALAIALPLLLLILKRRPLSGNLRLFVAPEILAGALVVLGYVASIPIFFPAFLDRVMPLVTSVYLPVRYGFPELLFQPSFLLFFAGLLSLRLTPYRVGEPIATTLALAAGGFAMANIIQAKGWPYHGYPSIALILMAVSWALIEPVEGDDERSAVPSARMGRGARIVAIGGVLALGGASFYWFSNSSEKPAVTEAVLRLAKPHPKIIAIGDDLALGHPLTRDVEGDWVGRTCNQWIAQYTKILLAHVEQGSPQQLVLKTFAAQNVAMLASDIQTRQPDVVLIQDADWAGWAARQAAVGAALSAYSRAAIVEGVTILLRRTT